MRYTSKKTRKPVHNCRKQPRHSNECQKAVQRPENDSQRAPGRFRNGKSHIKSIHCLRDRFRFGQKESEAITCRQRFHQFDDGQGCRFPGIEINIRPDFILCCCFHMQFSLQLTVMPAVSLPLFQSICIQTLPVLRHLRLIP